MSDPQDPVRNLLFRFDPETAHQMAINGLKLSRATGFFQNNRNSKHPNLKQNIAGLDFPNPLGMAAGFDKNAEVPDALLRIGFGFAEIGTVTPHPQEGNPRPRIFRLERDRAVINRLGFNNKGHEIALSNIENARKRMRLPGIIGINIGANKTSEDFVADYCAGLSKFWWSADYFTINISSPNTPGLRNLQNSEHLEELLGRIDEVRDTMSEQTGVNPPVFLKIAPDLDEEAISAICQRVKSSKTNGMIVSNTTISRPGLQEQHDEQGGLSGKPLFHLSTIVLAKVRALMGDEFPLIGVGGIDNAQTAWNKLEAGANLLQLYTGMIYQGPQLACKICKSLSHMVEKEGFTSISRVTNSNVSFWSEQDLD